VENELKNFIELRNNSAHGKEIDTVLNANELLQLCDFVEAICQAMSELVLYCFVDKTSCIIFLWYDGGFCFFLNS
jgi:hypothetical protein